MTKILLRLHVIEWFKLFRRDSDIRKSNVRKGNAANCPGSQLVGLFQLSLNVISQLADDFKILKS